MKKKLLLLVSLLLTACLLGSCAYLPIEGLTSLSSGTSGQTPVSEDGDTVTISREQYERYQQFDELLELIDITDTYFYQDINLEDMLHGAASGLLSGLGDPYTYYYPPEEYAEMWEEDEGEYGGIGIQISSSYLTGISTVSRVFENSPASEMGVQRGDILYRVGEDLYVTAYNIEEAVDIMRGVPGTTVDITFLRNGEMLTNTFTRAQVNVNRVEAGMLTDAIGYIYLYEFAGDCATQFTEKLNGLLEQGAKGLIIDLRDNPGGWVNDAQTIADLFVDQGILCYLEYKDGSRQYYRTTSGKTELPLVILVNEYSASSSEILAGCLKDRADATIVGVQSYGKGIVQSVIPVGSDGAAMQVTIAQYFTPNGNAVHGIGVTPDVEIALPEGDNGMYEFGSLDDVQLAEALRVMQEKMK